MATMRRLLVVTAALSLSGCGGEGIPPTPVGPSASPAVKSTTAPTGPGTGSAEQSGPASPKKAEVAPPARPKEGAGSNEAPPLEAPRTGSAGEEGAKVKLSDKHLANIRKLPEAEQSAAIKQAVCPVSEEALGSMGTPIKVTAEGRTFYLCCDGCENSVKSDPKGVIAKLQPR